MSVTEGPAEDSEDSAGGGVFRWNKPGSFNDYMEQRPHSSHRPTMNQD